MKTTAENDAYRFPPWWIENQADRTLEMTAASRHGGLRKAVVVDLLAVRSARFDVLEYVEREALEDIREAAAACPPPDVCQWPQPPEISVEQQARDRIARKCWADGMAKVEP